MTGRYGGISNLYHNLDDYKLSDHQFGQEDSLGLDHIDRTGRVNRIGLEKPLSIRG